MGHIWQLQEAKIKFSTLVEKAQYEGPQFVTKHGKPMLAIDPSLPPQELSIILPLSPEM